MSVSLTTRAIGSRLRMHQAECCATAFYRSGTLPAALAIASLIAGGCGGTDANSSGSGAAAPDNAAARPWFEERSTEAGIEFIHVSGHTNRHYMPEIMSGGVALIDLENNGFLDVYLVQGGFLGDGATGPPPRNRLYRNRGEGSFEDVTEGSGADDDGYGIGVAVGDFDNDGFADLYVTNLGPNVLLRNNGDRTFSDVTHVTGTGDSAWGASAAFFDMNNSGDLDLFVTNYLVWSRESELTCSGAAGLPDYCNPVSYGAPAPDLLLRNNGDGTFADVSSTAGLRTAYGNGLGVVCLDFNLSGWVDVFVANDKMPNQLWRNEGDGATPRFRDVAMLTGCAIDRNGDAKAGMGVHAADFTGDGYEDIVVVNLQSESDSLYQNRGGYFVDETIAAGLAAASRPFTRFGLGLHDFDNDGTLDMYQANGAVFRRSASQLFSDDPYAEPNLLMRGVHGAGGFAPRFEAAEPRDGTAAPLIATSRAAAFGDLTNDGGIDIVIVNRDGPAHFKRNVASGGGNWILFRVLTKHGRDAYNARVAIEIEDEAGVRTVVREVRAAYSYLASNDPRVHFGLGSAERVRQVRVKWLGGGEESFGEFDANRIVTIRQGSGERRGAREERRRSQGD